MVVKTRRQLENEEKKEVLQSLQNKKKIKVKKKILDNHIELSLPDDKIRFQEIIIIGYIILFTFGAFIFVLFGHPIKF